MVDVMLQVLTYLKICEMKLYIRLVTFSNRIFL